MGRGLKPQMKYANKTGARYTVVLGEDEVATGKARLKRMGDGAEAETTVERLVQSGPAEWEQLF